MDSKKIIICFRTIQVQYHYIDMIFKSNINRLTQILRAIYFHLAIQVSHQIKTFRTFLHVIFQSI